MSYLNVESVEEANIRIKARQAFNKLNRAKMDLKNCPKNDEEQKKICQDNLEKAKIKYMSRIKEAKQYAAEATRLRREALDERKRNMSPKPKGYFEGTNIAATRAVRGGKSRRPRRTRHRRRTTHKRKHSTRKRHRRRVRTHRSRRR